MNFLYVIRQRRRQLLAAFVVLVAAYLGYELLFARDYTAMAQVRAAHSPVANNQGLITYDQDFTAHVQLVQSGAFMTGMAARLTDADRTALMNEGRHWLGASETAGEILLERRIVTPNRGAQIIDLGFRDHDPALAARVANALADEFVHQSEAMNVASKERALADPQAEAAKLKQQADTLQGQLDGYEAKYGADKLDPMMDGVDAASLQELNHQAVEAKTNLDKLDNERMQIQQQILAGQPVWNVGFIASQPRVQAMLTDLHNFSTQLDQLRHEQYDEDGATMVELKGRIANLGTELADAAEVISKQVDSDYAAARTAANDTATRLEVARQQGLELARARAVYKDLREQHDTAQKLAAQKELELADQASKLQVSTATYSLLAGAEPPTTANPPPWVRFALHALGAGAGGTLLLAVGFTAFSPPPAEEREEDERRRRRHRRFHSSTRESPRRRSSSRRSD